MTPLEYLLYLLIVIAPLAIGGVHATTQVVLAGAAFALLLAVALGPLRVKGVRVPPFAWIAIAALAWTGLQLAPFPLFALRALSPHAAALRDELGARIAPLTLDPPATTLALCKLGAALCLLLVGAELLRNGARRAATVLAMLGGLVVVLVWVHRLGGATHLYGFYAPRSWPGSGIWAPFVSGNQAASLLALCALSAAGLAFGRKDTRGPLFGVLVFGATATLLATGSRGGALGLAFGALFFVTMLASERFGRTRALALSLSVVVVLGAGGLFVADGLRNRLTQTSVGNTLTENQKTRGWLVALHLADEYPLVGVGRGAFEAPAAQLRSEDEGVRLVFPENVVVQCASEWGWPMGLGLLGMLVAGFVVTLRRCRMEPPLIGLAAGVIAVAVHELFDFGLEFPGVLFPTTMAVAAIVACAEMDDRTPRRARPRLSGQRLVPVAIIGAFVLFAGVLVRNHTLDADLTARSDLDSSIRRHPASAELEVAAGEVALEHNDPSALRHLGRAMRLQPSASRPHTLAAVELERMHRYGQAALEFRLAGERGAQLSANVLVHRLGRYAIDAVPKTRDAYLEVGAIYAHYKLWDDAQRAYERAAEIDPGPAPRVALLSWLPPDRQPAALELTAKRAIDGDELARVVDGWSTLKQYDRAEQTLTAGVLRFPNDAQLAVAGARMRASHGDVEGAKRIIGRTARFDIAGRVAAEEEVLALDKQAGELDQAAAAEARLRLLRSKAHIDESSTN